MNELKRLRDKIGLSNKELSELSGVSEQTVKNRMLDSYKLMPGSKLEMEFLQLLANEYEQYALIIK